MKKSFDYFKTLKELSRINQQCFVALATGKDFKNNSIAFYGKRYELLQRLADDFVAPIERNDIYNLTNCLYNQFCEIVLLSDIIDNADIVRGFINDFNSLFEIQADVVCNLGKKNNSQSLIKLCRNGQQQSITLGRNISSVIYSRLKGDSQPLFKILVLSKIIDFSTNINNTLCQCERVTINNI